MWDLALFFCVDCFISITWDFERSCVVLYTTEVGVLVESFLDSWIVLYIICLFHDACVDVCNTFCDSCIGLYISCRKCECNLVDHHISIIVVYMLVIDLAPAPFQNWTQFFAQFWNWDVFIPKHYRAYFCPLVTIWGQFISRFFDRLEPNWSWC